MDRPGVGPEGSDATICPFLAHDGESSSCLADPEKVAHVGPGYASEFCFQAHHVACPWFRRAASDGRRAALDRSGHVSTPPPASSVPVITHPASGSHAGRNITLWGTSAPGTRVEILDGAERLATAETDDTGFWGTALHGMPSGPHRFQARTRVEDDEPVRCSVPVSIVVEAEQGVSQTPASHGSLIEETLVFESRAQGDVRSQAEMAPAAGSSARQAGTVFSVEARAAEAARQAEHERVAQEARRVEEARQAEQARRVEAERQAEEKRKAEAARVEAAARAEAARQAEIARQEEEAARQAELARQKEEAARQAELARQQEEERRADEARRAAAARLAHEARLAAEARRLEEAEQAEAALATMVAQQAEATRLAEARAAQAMQVGKEPAPPLAEAEAEPAATDEAIPAGTPPEAPSQARKTTRSRGLRPVLIAAVAVLAIAGAVVGLALHPFGRPAASQASRRPTQVPAPVPAASWRFAPTSRSPDQTIVVVNNPGRRVAAITVTAGATVQHATLQPQSESEMELAAGQRASALTVRSSVPIIVQRIDIRKGKSYASYGTHT